jgi:PBSX family phage portal protein
MTEQAIVAAAKPGTVEAFSFGDDVSVIDGRSAWGYFDGVWRNGDWYEPPVPMMGLAKAYRMSAHHQAAIGLKLNLLRKHFMPSRWLDANTHDRLALDFLQMGQFYAEELLNLGGRLLRYKHAPAMHTRAGVERGRYFWTRPDPSGFALGATGMHEFAPGSICHVQEPDVEQEIYGVPQWLGALQSGLLNEAATLFRRRYYLNNASAGFVFYASEGTLNDKDAKAIREKLSQAKGRGNFKNMFIHAPSGKKDGIQILPISDVAAKDEFAGIKNVSRDDILAANRVPPQLIGVVPQNSGGFGDVRSAMDMFFDNEIVPLMMKMTELNDHAGQLAVQYRDYVRMMPAGVPVSAR